MTEVRKPGGHCQVVRVLFVFQLETQTVSHKFFTDFLNILIIISATLKLV